MSSITRHPKFTEARAAARQQRGFGGVPRPRTSGETTSRSAPPAGRVSLGEFLAYALILIALVAALVAVLVAGL